MISCHKLKVRILILIKSNKFFNLDFFFNISIYCHYTVKKVHMVHIIIIIIIYIGIVVKMKVSISNYHHHHHCQLLKNIYTYSIWMLQMMMKMKNRFHSTKPINWLIFTKKMFSSLAYSTIFICLC